MFNVGTRSLNCDTRFSSMCVSCRYNAILAPSLNNFYVTASVGLCFTLHCEIELNPWYVVWKTDYVFPAHDWHTVWKSWHCLTLRNNVKYNTKIHSEGRLDIHTIELTIIHKEDVLTVSAFRLEAAVWDVAGCASLSVSLGGWRGVNTDILFDSGSTARMLVPTFSSISRLEQASENIKLWNGVNFYS